MSDISFAMYAMKAAETAIYPNAGKDMTYPLLGLRGEIGEVCEHLKKTIRDDCGKLSKERIDKLHKECGDVAWYIAAIMRTIDKNQAVSLTLFKPVHGTEHDKPSLEAAIKAVDNLSYYAVGMLGMLQESYTQGEILGQLVRYWKDLCNALGFHAGNVLEANLTKLFDRKDRGVLKGSGDDR